jgi:predicted nucleic acid-binding protein
MSEADTFIDTSVLLYLLSADDVKADRAEELLANGAVLGVQVLNEFASVATRKLGLTVPEVREILATIRGVVRVEPLTEETHDRALQIAERYRFSVFDSLMIAAALLSGCRRLCCEDLQHNQIIDRQLRITNPFHAGAI